MAKKRMNGEGSWTKRDNGTWKLSVSYKGLGRKYFYGTKQECMDKKRKFESLLPTDIVGEKDILFKDFARSWLTNIKQPVVKPTTYDRINYIIENILVNKIGNLALIQIDDSILQTTIINQLKIDGYSYSTVQFTNNILSQILQYASTRGKIQKNPMKDVTVPKRSLFETKEKRFLSEEERNKLVDACYSTFANGNRRYKFGAFYVFLLYTGLRIGEGLALKWKHIDFEKRTVYVSRTIITIYNKEKSGNNKILVDQPTTKTGKSRTVYLSDMALNALYDLKEHMGYDPEKYIVYTKNNTNMRPTDAYKTFQYIIKRANITKCTIHSLRHSFVSMMIGNGVPIIMVSAMVGHTSIGNTMKVYSHLLQETQAESIKIIKNLQ